METHFNDHSLPVASALFNEAVVEQRAHRLEVAVNLYARAFTIIKSTRPSTRLSETVARSYAGVLSQLHRDREAKQILAEASAFHGQ